MNVFMGYNPTVAKQVKVSVWVKEIDGAEPIFPASPSDGDCFIVFDTDDDVLADNPSSKKSYANGSWGDAGGGGGSGAVIPEVTLTITSATEGTYTSTVPFDEMYTMGDIYSDGRFPLVVHMSSNTIIATLASAFQGSSRSVGITLNGADIGLMEDGTVKVGEP